MADNVVDLLRAHEATLDARIVALSRELQPLLEEIAATRRALASVGTVVKQLPASNRVIVPASPTAAQAARAFASMPDVSRMTMKQLVQLALSRTHVNGATANELLETFHSWGRTDIVRSSLSPQLSRLKQDGVIELEGYVWRISASDRPQLFGSDEPDEIGDAQRAEPVDPDEGDSAPLVPDTSTPSPS